jgi:hypothetical protein
MHAFLLLLVVDVLQPCSYMYVIAVQASMCMLLRKPIILEHALVGALNEDVLAGASGPQESHFAVFELNGNISADGSTVSSLSLQQVLRFRDGHIIN